MKNIDASRSVTAALAQEGVRDYTRSTTEVIAERAPSLQARHLLLTEGAPLLCAQSINVDPDGVPIEFGRTWFAGERVRLLFGEDIS